MRDRPDPCPRCGDHHVPRCPTPYTVDRMWPTSALYEAVKGRVQVTRLAKGKMPELIPDQLADRWAVKLGLHPEQVWPGWCEAALTVSDDLFVNGGGWRQAWEWAEEQNRSDKENAA